MPPFDLMSCTYVLLLAWAQGNTPTKVLGICGREWDCPIRHRSLLRIFREKSILTLAITGNCDIGRSYVQLSSGADVAVKIDTKTRILDAAEALFAENGFDAVPIRAIMRLADARLGLMNYYFESKDSLLEAVIERRAYRLNSERQRLLEEFAGSEDSSVTRVVDAIVDPYLAFMLDEDIGWHHYGRLIASLAQSQRWSGLIHRYFDDISMLLVNELARLHPWVDRSIVVRNFVFAIGSELNFFSISGRMRLLSNGAVDDDDLAKGAVDLKRFMVHGLTGAFAQ